MKKNLQLILAVLIMAPTSYGQSPIRKGITSATQGIDNLKEVNNLNFNQPKALLCQDTLRYPQLKEQVVGISNFYTFELWTDDAEYMSQAFLLSGSTMNIHGVEVFARRNPSSTANLSLRGAIYNVDASNNPTTQIGFANITITDTNYSYRQINFATPISVSNNYAVVIQPTSTGGIVDFYVNDAAPNQSIDEGLSKIRSSWYATSNGNWVSVPVLTSGFTGGPYDFEALVAPKVSYNITTGFSMSANPACVGTPVNFTNTTTPANTVSSRFYNFNSLRTHFLSFPDSTYVWDVDGVSPLIWSQNTSFTYNTAGAYNPTLYTLGGLWSSCLDFQANPITINTGSTTITAGGPTTFCDGGSVLLTSDGTGGGLFQWFLNGNPVGTNSNTYTATTAGTYTVEYTLNGCTGISNTISTTVNTPTTPNVSASGATTFCIGGSVTLNSSGTGNYQWYNGATPVGTNSASHNVTTTGSYTVELTDLNGCSAVSNAVSVTVNPLDDATFTYGTNTVCAGGGNITPTVNTTPGTFSSTPAGLIFISTATGEIDMNNTTNNTYTVVYSTNGTCPNSSSQAITITSSPEAEFSYAQASYCQNEINPSPVFVPGGSAGSFSSTPVGLTMNVSGVINLSLSQPGTYAVTNTIAAAGACPADQYTFTVTINETPTATVSGGGSTCDDGITTIAVSITLTGNGPWDFTYSDGTNNTPVTNQANSTFVINASNNGTYTVTLINDANCTGTASGSASVIFNQNPAVSLPSFPNVCDNSAPVNLTGENPTGGIYSGVGITGNTFDPSSLTAGVYIINYDYTDGNGCSGSASATIEVVASPVVTLSPLSTVCVDAAPIVLSGGSPAGGAYSGSGVNNGEFNPTTAGVGTHTITYSLTANGCTGTDSQTVTVDACTSIGEQFVYNLQIFPNPSNGYITISFDSGTNNDIAIKLMTVEGKLVFNDIMSTSLNYSKTIDVSPLSKGIYILQIQSVLGTINNKIIVQ